MMKPITLHEIAKMIDHSLLHPTMTDEDIIKGCELSKKHDVATACIKPYAIPMVKEILAGSCTAETGMNGREVDGRSLKVNESRPREDRGGGGRW